MTEYIRLAEVEAGHIVDPLEAGALTVVYNSMQVVYRGMQTKDLLGTAQSSKKADGSLVTSVDMRSEALAGAIMQDMLPNVRFRSEEGARSGSGDILLGFDPLDGTRNFAVGATDATVIATLYNADLSVYGAAIGQPATGRVYSAFNGKSTEGRLISPKGPTGVTEIHVPEVSVWQGDMSDKGQVFIDNTQPRIRNGHEVMTRDQLIDLRRRIQALGAGILELGSNGAQQLAVLSGGEKAAAAITTARGVWEDTSAGAYLTERSGGAVQRYVTVDGYINPVDEIHHDYDMLVAANNQETLLTIDGILADL